MLKTTESSHPTKSNQERRNLRAAGILLAGTALLSACSSGSGNTTPEATRAITPTVSATIEVKSPQLLALEKKTRAFEQKEARKKAADVYLTSGERNATLEVTVQTVGKKIITAAEDKRIGYFDFYNITTSKWGRGKGNEGWGFLQHNAQYGGSQHQVSATVYQNADGGFNLAKGVQSVEVGMHNAPNLEVVKIESPAVTKIISGIELPTQAYEVSILNAKDASNAFDVRKADSYNFDVLNVQKLAAIDAEGVGALNRHIKQLGL